jgi:hypothetical protein
VVAAIERGFLAALDGWPRRGCVARAFLQRFAAVTALAAEAGAAVTEETLPDDDEGSRNGPF